MALPEILKGRLSVPAVAAPLFIISGPELVIAQCKAGVVGSFPSLNARGEGEFEKWLIQITEELDAYDIHLLDVTEQKFAEQKVKHLAFYQPLTNLPNQYKLNEDIDLHLADKHHFSLGIFAVSDFNQLVSSVGVEATSLLVTTLTKNIISQLEVGVNLYQLNDSQFALISQHHISEVTLENLTFKILQIPMRSSQLYVLPTIDSFQENPFFE